MVNSRQYKMLKRISKHNLFEYTDFSEDESEIIKFLANQGLLYIQQTQIQNLVFLIKSTAGLRNPDMRKYIHSK